MKIGILSDTHGWLDPRILDHFSEMDEIWHAGDVGPNDILAPLNAAKPCRAVFGNIDGSSVRASCKEFLVFDVCGSKILMIHIAGPFGSYSPQCRALIHAHHPDVLICGHSHILKVAWDKSFNLLYVNPGAAGQQGFHHVRTIIRLNITEKGPSDFEVIELGKRSKGAGAGVGSAY